MTHGPSVNQRGGPNSPILCWLAKKALREIELFEEALARVRECFLQLPFGGVLAVARAARLYRVYTHELFHYRKEL